MSHRAAIYGRQHRTYGALHVRPIGPRGAIAMSAGADPRSPSTRFKADLDQPNEDALLLVDDGDRVLLAVADSHFGLRASHDLIERLAAIEAIPDDSEGLARWLDSGRAWPPSVDDHSESTLCVAVFDRTTGQGSGLSIGDSTLAVLSADGWARHNPHTQVYVHPGRNPRPSRITRPFAFEAAPGALVLAYTDGVDECHYRRPETSVRPAHFEALFDAVGPAPEPFARRLAEMALTGVDGHPGGQDNIALVVAAV